MSQSFVLESMSLNFSIFEFKEILKGHALVLIDENLNGSDVLFVSLILSLSHIFLN